MYPLHEDFVLTSEQQRRVLDYVREIGFALPGAEPEDFTAVVPRARYAGWDFMSEDLESYSVGLICSKPGYERQHTFIRMSYGQLMGEPDAPRLPVNEPICATQALRMQRWWDTPAGPSRTGVDSYVSPESGNLSHSVELDLRMIGDTLEDILAFDASGAVPGTVGHFDFKVDWGILLAGRFQRLRYLRDADRLDRAHSQALEALEQRIEQATPVLEKWELPTLATLARPEKRRHAAHHG